MGDGEEGERRREFLRGNNSAANLLVHNTADVIKVAFSVAQSAQLLLLASLLAKEYLPHPAFCSLGRLLYIIYSAQHLIQRFTDAKINVSIDA